MLNTSIIRAPNRRAGILANGFNIRWPTHCAYR